MKRWQAGGSVILSSGRLGSFCWPVAPQLWQTSEQLWLLSWTTAAQPALLITRQAVRLPVACMLALQQTGAAVFAPPSSLFPFPSRSSPTLPTKDDEGKLAVTLAS